MSKLNEKLAASVKATGHRAATVKPQTKAKPAETETKTSAVKSAVSAPAGKTAVPAKASPEPHASGTALFPNRIWPD